MYLENSISHTLGYISLSGMLVNLVKSFMRHVYILISTMLLLNYWTKILTKKNQDKNKSRMDKKKEKKWALLTQT